jgi:protein phosphatase
MAPLVDVNAAARDLKHVLTNAMGMVEPTSLKIDLERLRLRDRDLILVCTNGVTDALDESDIATILRTSMPPGEQCRSIVDRAIAADGQDDATALIGHFHFP